MRKPKIHDDANCFGTLVRVYDRPDRSGSFSPIGYVCRRCRLYLPDPTAIMTLADLRPAADALANEISSLLLEKQVHDRVAGMVRSNSSLLYAAQTGNPFLQGMRRWWATSAALVLRRHLDGGTRNSLRDLLEALAALPDEEVAGPRFDFAEDLRDLEALSARFREYLNNLLHGSLAVPPPENVPTYSDLNDAIDTIAGIAGRVYAAITNISYQMDPVIQFDWTKIFREPWIADNTPMAYSLGAQGVPIDALSLELSESQQLARLGLQIGALRDREREITVINEGPTAALDVRVFLPYNRTVVDVPELASGAKTMSMVPAQSPPKGYKGQAVLEFADVHDRIYRQYADVDLDLARVRKLSPMAFRVSGRIVERKAQGVS
jgi:hypothetical protein